MKRQSAADLPAYGQILPNSHFSNRIMQNNSMNFDQKRVNNYTYQTSNKDHYKAQSLSQTSNPYTRRGRHDSNPTALKNIILMRNAMHRRQSNNHLNGSQNRNNNVDHYGVQQNRNQLNYDQRSPQPKSRGLAYSYGNNGSAYGLPNIDLSQHKTVETEASENTPYLKNQ